MNVAFNCTGMTDAQLMESEQTYQMMKRLDRAGRCAVYGAIWLVRAATQGEQGVGRAWRFDSDGRYLFSPAPEGPQGL